jgi:hypothetical protein
VVEGVVHFGALTVLVVNPHKAVAKNIADHKPG